MTPEVSIAIPCYNQAKYLPETLGSLLLQTEHNWEAIVVDDCSTEGDAAAVVARLGDPRIRASRHAVNRGLAAARNTGMREASSDLLLPLDADDMLAPRYLERVVAALRSHPEADCAYTAFQCFGAERDYWPWELGNVESLFYEQWIPGPGALLRRSLWERVGGYCEAEELRKGNEDWDFWLGAAERGFYAIRIAEPLYQYRRQVISMSVWQRSYEYYTRSFLYRRHKHLFDSYGAGSGFLARAYYASAKAAWATGRPLRAAALGLRGFLHRIARRDCLQRAFLALVHVIAPPSPKVFKPSRLCGTTLETEAQGASVSRQ
jgi:glycosyltransferase involved in cell wall biosynthesis